MRAFAIVLVLSATACSTQAGDPHSTTEAGVLGSGMRLRDVQNPANKLAGSNVDVTTAVVTAVDNFDETHDGKSRGTIYLQDADKGGPLAAITLFSPSFQPTSLRLAPGDVVDLAGQYTEQTKIGTTVDFTPNFLPQLVKPVCTFRFEVGEPKPIVIQLSDLASFTTGRQWIGQLVTVQNVTALTAPAGDSKNSGRVTANLSSSAQNGPQISNELYDMQPTAFAANTTFKSVTGLVTFFFNLKIAPRSQADLVQ
jgi:hypothetical protein